MKNKKHIVTNIKYISDDPGLGTSASAVEAEDEAGVEAEAEDEAEVEAGAEAEAGAEVEAAVAAPATWDAAELAAKAAAASAIIV